MARPKVVVAGHICLDITPVFPTGSESGMPVNGATALKDILCPGKLTRVSGVDIHTGGAVANTGLAMALFGADVSLMGKVGKDAFGSMILGILHEHGAGKGMIVSDDVSTSYSIVVAVPGCDRIFLHDPGANDTFRFSDLDFDRVREASLFHFGYPPLMASMFRNEGAELVRMFQAVNQAGVMTSLDLAAIDEHSEAGSADWEKILAETLPNVDFFMPSIEELAFMLDKRILEKIRARSGDGDIISGLSIEKDVEPLAERAIDLGAKVVLVKCGAKGLYYRTARRPRMEKLAAKYDKLNTGMAEKFPGDWSALAGFEKSFRPERILSGTGAGDTTIAAFLASAIEGYSFSRCVQLAAATGASCVEAYDALGGLKSFAELESKIDAGWRKGW